MNATPFTFSLATFNLHAGVDGWGRPFDVVASCRAIDADILVLQECWSPDDGEGLASRIGQALGYTVIEKVLARGRRGRPRDEADHRWMRPLAWSGPSHALYLDSERPLRSSITSSTRFEEAESGDWGLALLSRLPVHSHEIIDLGRLQRDCVRRAAIVVRIGNPAAEVTVVGTHMAHLTYGSPKQFLRLAHALEGQLGRSPAALAGDMNLWGPPVRSLLRRWHRAVKGRTWPAWRPHSQVDHILVRGPLRVRGARVLAMAGSDHRPIRAELAVD